MIERRGRIVKKVVIGVVLVAAVMFGITEWVKYTAFDKAVSPQLNEETEVKNIGIRVNRISDDYGYPETEARATIEDRAIIESLLEHFSQLELKQHENNNSFGEYSLSIMTTNETEENFFETTTLNLELGQEPGFITIAGEYYEILNDVDPLAPIEALVDSDEVEWISIE